MTEDEARTKQADEATPPSPTGSGEKGDGEKGTPPKDSRGLASWFAAAALVLSLVALAGVGASAWAWYQLRGEQSRIATLEGRTSGVEGRLAELRHSMARASDLQALQNRVATLARAQQSRDAAYTARIDALSARLGNGVLSYREDEAEALMRLAQSRLDVDGNVRASLQALQLADQVLAGANASGLTPVRTALAQEIQALKAVPQPDITGAVARLTALSGAIDGLPLAGEHFRKPSSAGTSSVPAGWSWRGFGQALKRAFSPLVVVRRGPEARPLLPPHEAYFVRENIKLALVSARAALLQRDPASYHASLAQASHWIDAWFDTSAAGVRAATDTIQQLSALDLKPPLPPLGAALTRLRAIRSARDGS
jgi:uroporphyrin-III C-methyltransferase